jgi:hypothetical protein
MLTRAVTTFVVVLALCLIVQAIGSGVDGTDAIFSVVLALAVAIGSAIVEQRRRG